MPSLLRTGQAALKAACPFHLSTPGARLVVADTQRPPTQPTRSNHTLHRGQGPRTVRPLIGSHVGCTLRVGLGAGTSAPCVPRNVRRVVPCVSGKVRSRGCEAAERRLPRARRRHPFAASDTPGRRRGAYMYLERTASLIVRLLRGHQTPQRQPSRSAPPTLPRSSRSLSRTVPTPHCYF